MQIDDLISLAERELSIKLPNDYIDYTKDGTFKNLYSEYEIYFLDADMINFDVAPCAIGVTKIFRNKNIIPYKDSIAIMNQDSNIYFLDTSKDIIYYNEETKIINLNITLFEWINQLCAG